jgi:hypothetical protein
VQYATVQAAPNRVTVQAAPNREGNRMSNTPSFTALIHLNAARTYLAAALVEVRWAEDELEP